jgi:hypothetical protein
MNEDPHRIVADAAGDTVDQLQPKQSTKSFIPSQTSETVESAAELSVDDVACKFLRLILPEHGPYVAMIVEAQGRKYNRFAATIDELWEIIKKADEAGCTAYHACSSFREAFNDPKGTPRAQRRLGRTKSNVLCAKSFWLDIDVGPGKPYADCLEAGKALAEFCKKSG